MTKKTSLFTLLFALFITSFVSCGSGDIINVDTDKESSRKLLDAQLKFEELASKSLDSLLENTTIILPSSSSEIIDPESSSSVIDPGTSSSTIDPGTSSSTIDPISSSSIIDPISSSSIIDPISSSSIIDPISSSSIIDPISSSSIITVTPPQITQPTQSVVGTDLTIKWNVYAGTQPEFYEITATCGTNDLFSSTTHTTTSFTVDFGVCNGETVNYSVTPVAGTALGTTKTGSYVIPVIPEISTIVASYDEATMEITLSWTATKGLADSYDITIDGNIISQTPIANKVTIDLTTYADKTVEYSVTPKNTLGSGTAQIGTQEVTYITPEITLKTPSYNENTVKLTLSWTVSAGAPTSYDITIDGDVISATPNNNAVIIDVSTYAGKTVTYSVTPKTTLATGTAGTGTQEITLPTPILSAITSAYNPTTKMLDLSWSTATGASNYYILSIMHGADDLSPADAATYATTSVQIDVSAITTGEIVTYSVTPVSTVSGEGVAVTGSITLTDLIPGSAEACVASGTTAANCNTGIIRELTSLPATANDWNAWTSLKVLWVDGDTFSCINMQSSGMTVNVNGTDITPGNGENYDLSTYKADANNDYYLALPGQDWINFKACE